MKRARTGLTGFTRVNHLVFSIPLCLATQAALATPLDPMAFAPIGTLSVNSGVVTINTDTLQITGGGGGLISTSGVVHGQGAGNPDVAVFAFDGVNVGSSVTFQVIGSRPLAMLSRGDLRMLASINVSGAHGTDGGAGTNGPNGHDGVAGHADFNSGGFGAPAPVAAFPGGKGGDGGFATQTGQRGSDGFVQFSGGGDGGPGGPAFIGFDLTSGGSPGVNGIDGRDGINGMPGAGGAARNGAFVLSAGGNGDTGQAGTHGHGGGGGGGAGGRHSEFLVLSQGKGGGGGSGGAGASGGAGGQGGVGGNAIELGAIGELTVSSMLAQGGNGGLGGSGGTGGTGGIGGPTATQVGKGGDGGDGGNGGQGGMGGGGSGGVVYLHGGEVRVTQPLMMNGGAGDVFFARHGADGVFKLAGTLSLDVASAGVFDRVDVLGDYDVADTDIRFEFLDESIADNFTALFNFDSFFIEDHQALADIAQFQSLDITAVSPTRQFDITLNPDRTFTMTAVPEPLTIGIVAPLAVCAMLRRRRRSAR